MNAIVRQRAYAGIGSRVTPEAVRMTMASVATRLGEAGYVLRSGGADGADAAFGDAARAANLPRTIYLPWPGFNDVTDESAVVLDSLPGSSEAIRIAADYHPAWDALKPAVRKLMARNVMQVLGDDCQSPARFVICWATGSKFDHAGRVCNVAGGTGQAVRIAHDHGIQVFNLEIAEHAERLRVFVGGDA